jgi:hypothetical protein
LGNRHCAGVEVSDPDEQHLRKRPPYGKWEVLGWVIYGAIGLQLLAFLALLAWSLK